MSWRWRISASLMIFAAVATLGCGGLMFGPPCDGSVDGYECTGPGGYRSCQWNEWTGEHHWMSVDCHPSESCSEPSPGATICALEPRESCGVVGERRCDGDEVHACGGPLVRDELLWHVEDTCDPGWECRQVGAAAGCVVEGALACDREVERYRCVDGQPQECTAMLGPDPSQYAYFWRPRPYMTCGSSEVCEADADDVACVAAPPTSCDPASDAERCVDGRKQRCHVGNGGGEMGPPTPRWVWTSIRCG